MRRCRALVVGAVTIPLAFTVLAPVAGLAQSDGAPAAAGLSVVDEDLIAIDVVRISAGFRATEVIGQDVRNALNEEVGEVDDLVISPNDEVLFAVIAVGGFLGIGDRLVAVPYERLRFDSDGVVLEGATQQLLEQLPEFRYRDNLP